ncbi:MAG: hypothetical protein ACKOJ9_09645 [Actinomycetota bacterium]
MSNEPTNEQLDDWASAVVDGVTSLDDIDSEWRDRVSARADEFTRVRSILRASSNDDRDDVFVMRTSRSRRAGMWVASLATAAAVAAIVGVAVGSSNNGDNDIAVDSRIASPESVAGAAADLAMSTMSAAPQPEAPAASEAPAAEAGVRADDAPAICADELRPVLIREAVVDGETVEIHWSMTDGVVVYRIADCSVVLATTP